jgi:hypothetical protein
MARHGRDIVVDLWRKDIAHTLKYVFAMPCPKVEAPVE